jgi:predicted aspartyl protease
VDHILTAASILSGSAGRSADYAATPNVLRRVKRLIWFALVACVALIGTLESHQDLPQQLSVRLALAIILVASWAIVMHVTVHLRSEDARRTAESEAARLEGARMTASAMQDRIANKLSLTVGYAEFLVTDPRLPEDLRDHAQRAMDGARAAAEQMSELKRLTRQHYETQLQVNGSAPTTPGKYDSDRLRELMTPTKTDLG